jgi:hypothetical protein
VAAVAHLTSCVPLPLSAPLCLHQHTGIKDARTPLHLAAGKGRAEVMQALMMAGAGVDAIDKVGVKHGQHQPMQ